MSAEPSRKKAYHSDVRWRIVYQRIGMGFTFDKIAKNLNVATSTVHRTFTFFLQSGDVEPLPRNRSNSLRKMDPCSELYVLGLVHANPTLYLGEICHDLKNAAGIDASPSTICRTLKQYGITRKTVRQIALQRCEQMQLLQYQPQVL